MQLIVLPVFTVSFVISKTNNEEKQEFYEIKLSSRFPHLLPKPKTSGMWLCVEIPIQRFQNSVSKCRWSWVRKGERRVANKQISLLLASFPSSIAF